ncbi:archaeosortase/exosortase family protein [Thermodesulfobacteriota bacterium]
MKKAMNSGLAAVVMQMLVFAPVWKWYYARMKDGSDEPWGLLALATYLFIVFTSRTETDGQRGALVIPAIVTLMYAASFPFVPKLIQAMLAVTAVGCTIACQRFGTALHVSSGGLLLLSLPVISALQFYAGYPMRVLSGLVSVFLLRMSGFAVELDGVCLRWGTELIAIDAPCSGVKMLWAGLYLTLTLACWLRAGNVRTVAALFAALTAVILANGVRASALFSLEVSLAPVDQWVHGVVGLPAFAGTAIFIVWFMHRFGGAAKCADTASS